MTDDDHKQELRIWLRLFASTTLIENEIRSRLGSALLSPCPVSTCWPNSTAPTTEFRW